MNTEDRIPPLVLKTPCEIHNDSVKLIDRLPPPIVPHSCSHENSSHDPEPELEPKGRAGCKSEQEPDRVARNIAKEKQDVTKKINRIVFLPNISSLNCFITKFFYIQNNLKARSNRQCLQ
jgi:hypothetical protein